MGASRNYTVQMDSGILKSRAHLGKLGSAIDKLAINGCKFIAGDLNARLGACWAGGENTIGEYSFGNEIRALII